MTKHPIALAWNANARTARFLEEGSAFVELTGLAASSTPASAAARRSAAVDRSAPERLDVVVIGGGQAGLSVGHYLQRHGLRFAILDASARVGDSWRARWDSLRLFTPARYDGLAGMPFPGRPDAFPTKDEMADYLEAYARRFALPVHSGTRVERLSRRGERYVIEAGGAVLEADHVVIAMANYQQPRVPAFAAQLRSDIVQLHSSAYRNPAQLRPGPVLIAGAGNSGSEIALELARDHRVWMAGRDTGHVPFRIEGVLGRYLLVHVVLRLVFHFLLTVRTPLGRKVRSKVLSAGGPLIRVKPRDLAAAGVLRTPKVVGVRDGLPLLEDGRVLDVASVVWCTGFDAGRSFVDLPVFGEDGQPQHDAGVVSAEPGLYFVGLHFLYAMSSTMIHGVARDAARIAGVIADRVRSRAAADGAYRAAP